MRISIFVRGLVVLLCVAGVVVSVIARHSRAIQGDVFVQFVKDRDTDKALERLNDAKRLNPDGSIAIAQARFAGPERGVKFLEDATRREPENVQLWVRLSQQQRDAGDQAGSQRSYARARELDSQLPPKGPPPGN